MTPSQEKNVGTTGSNGDRDSEDPTLSRSVGSRIARHVLYLAAVHAVRRSAEWRALYLPSTAQGKTAKQALIAVAVKWLHTAYAMLKHRAPSDPTRLAGMPATLST